MAKKRKKSKIGTKLFAAIVVTIIIAILAFIAWGYFVKDFRSIDDYLQFLGITTKENDETESNVFDENTVKTVTDGEFSVHFLELGNNYTGDCIFIKIGDVDILIDAGSRTNSIPTIKNYLDQYVTDGTLEFVIATHADQDHIAGFAGTKSTPSLFTYYDCEIIIDFARTKKTTTVYNNYVAARDAEVKEGAKHYTALDCTKQINGAKKVYELGENTTMEILYQKYYEEDTNDENDYSVCTMFKHGDKYYLLTGDLEEHGEKSLVANNNLPKVELYKAGHHGSRTSSTTTLLEKIQPKIVCVCCCAGSDEYTPNVENMFPTQEFINNVAQYTTNVFVTSVTIYTVNGVDSYLSNAEAKKAKTQEERRESLNGCIIIMGSVTEDTQLFFSKSSTKLKDTAWFAATRQMPSAWI